ncbi:MAG: NeuD/PglB/VioB family sugar acetyltransferase [Flammeovirgaceae bacterium]
MENPVIIFGANPIGRTAKEIFELSEVVVYGFLDDAAKLHKVEIDDATVLGATDDDGFLKLIGKKCEAFVAIDDNRLRKSIVKVLNEIRHVQPVNALHPKAHISERASIGHGNFVDFGALLAPGSKMGAHCLIHANAVVGAEATIGDFVQVGAGSVVNANVVIEDEVFIGSGVIIVSGVTIGKGARVGAGAVVIAPVKAGDTVFGNPAQVVK